MLFRYLRQIEAGDCFFAYRMVIVQLRREMPLQQVCFACLPDSTTPGLSRRLREHEASPHILDCPLTSSFQYTPDRQLSKEWLFLLCRQ